MQIKCRQEETLQDKSPCLLVQNYRNKLHGVEVNILDLFYGNGSSLSLSSYGSWSNQAGVVRSN